MRRIRESVIGDDHVMTDPLRRRAASPTPTTRHPAARWRSSRTSSATRCCPATPTPTPSPAAPGCRRPGCARTPGAIIHDAVGGDDDTVVIFAGSGCTGAIDKLIGVLGLRIPSALEDRYAPERADPADQRPVVFIGPYEHHSNEIPWRESIADVVTIREDADGRVDLDDLRERLGGVRRPAADDRLVLRGLQRHRHRHPTPTAISTLLHEHGALAFWDFAAAAPYVDIEMTAPTPATRSPTRTRSSSRRTSSSAARRRPGCSSRGASCSPTGCPTCPAAAPSPTSTPTTTRYLADPAHREEGGTPAIIEAIRAGPGLPAQGGRRRRRRSARTRSGFLRRAVDGVAAGAGHRDPRQPRRRAAVDRVVRRARADGPATCTTTSSSRCSTTCSASSRAAAARAPAPTATGCSASTSSARTSSSARSPAAARASSPAGCGSTSTTSSPTPSPTTSSRPCASSRATAGGCSATTSSTRSTGRWRHRDGLVEPPIRLAAISYADDGAMVDAAARGARGGEELLARAPARRRRDPGRRHRRRTCRRTRPTCRRDFEHLRWFDLPESAIAP